MKFYAYIPTYNGLEPMGTGNKILFELKTNAGAIKRCRRVLGDYWRLFNYKEFYDNATFTQIKISYPNK